MDCETCVYYAYEEEGEYYECSADMDEDDYGRLVSGGIRSCPFYQPDDEYRIVRKQM